MLKEAITTVAKGENLDSETMAQVMTEIMSGEGTDAQKAAFLSALSIKGESIDEITAATQVLRDNMVPFHRTIDAMEIVGTGGDRSNTINISTGAAILASAAGVPVAKHGNRAASSKSGTADCLEALGVKLDMDPEVAEKCLNEHGLTFLFAQKYHPAMRYVGKVRKEIGIKTLFNCLGPLANPARCNMQVFGVYDEALVEPLAHVLANLGVKRAMTVYGLDTMDEISMSADTKVCEVIDGKYRTYILNPEDYGFKKCKKEDLVGGTPEENAHILLDILKGAQGPKTDVIVLNAGAAISLAKGISLEDGIKEAREVIANGKALAKLEEFIEASNNQ